MFNSSVACNIGVSEISVLFAPYGSISSMVVLTDGHNGGSRGVSLVRYYSIESASTAIAALHGRYGTFITFNLLNVILAF